MASKTKVTPQREEALEMKRLETPPDTPLLDLSGAPVKKLIRSANKRGYVTHDQINSVLTSARVNSEQIEDVLPMLREMGVNVIDTEQASDEGEKAHEENQGEGVVVFEGQQKVPAKSEAKEPTQRTDDPVRMYLREMGSVKLLSREGEIVLAKRIEAGREAMIAGLCESPLTFQAIIIWRDELKEGKIFLRDIIDFEATYDRARLQGAGDERASAFLDRRGVIDRAIGARGLRVSAVPATEQTEHMVDAAFLAAM